MQVNDSIDSALGDLGRPPSPMKGVVGGVSSKVAAVAVVLVLALVATAVAAVAASCSCSSFPRAPRERATLPMRYQGTSAMSRAVSRPMNCAMNLRVLAFRCRNPWRACRSWRTTTSTTSTMTSTDSTPSSSNSVWIEHACVVEHACVDWRE